MLNVKMLPLNIQSKWEKEVHTVVVIEDWSFSFIYRIRFSVTKDTRLQDFQYKLMHRILITIIPFYINMG
jgi:heme/copper-type cytochrome/quinol oxidase subunit 2